MQTTKVRKGTSETHGDGSHPGDPHDMRAFLKRFALRGRDPAVADENLYRYCGNDPVNATDPAGLAPPSDAAPKAAPVKSFNIIVAQYLLPWDDPKKRKFGVTGDFGGASASFIFGVPKGTNGFAIQEVTIEYHVTHKVGDGNEHEYTPEELAKAYPKNGIEPKEVKYYEAWPIKDGLVLSWAATTKKGFAVDGFETPDFGPVSKGDCTKGSVKITGVVKAVAIPKLPDTFKAGNVKAAVGLPSTTTMPGFWNDIQGGATHALTTEWDGYRGEESPTKRTVTP